MANTSVNHDTSIGQLKRKHSECSERNVNFKGDVLLRYYPRSFKDLNNEQYITRSSLIKELLDNLLYGYCYSEHIYDQRSIRPYFDFDLEYHLSNEEDIIRTLDNIQSKLIHLCSKIAKKDLDLAVSKVFKHATKNGKVIPKLSIHVIVCDGLQLSPLGLYHFVHDNEQFLNELGADLVVYPKQVMSHKKFRCVNTCKEGEGLECMLLPYTHVDNLEKHLIQCEHDAEQFVDYKPANQKTYSYSTIKTKNTKKNKNWKKRRNRTTTAQKNKKSGIYWIV